jgi:hypothetical protein
MSCHEGMNLQKMDDLIVAAFWEAIKTEARICQEAYNTHLAKQPCGASENVSSREESIHIRSTCSSKR